MISLLLPRWMKSLLGKTLFRAKRRQLLCPDCGGDIPSPIPSPEALWDSRVDCPNCQATFSLTATKTLRDLTSGPAGDVVHAGGIPDLPKPVGTKIEVAMKDGVVGWRIPAKGGCNFFLFFSIFWLGITSFVFSAVTFGTPNGAAPLMAKLMAGAFVTIGLAILYMGLRMSRIQHWVWITDTALLHEEKLFRTRRRIFPRSSIRSVELVVVYTQNYEPVHGVEIVSAEGKLRFGTALTPADKAWLCQDIRRVLGLASPQAATASQGSPSSPQLVLFNSTIQIDSEPGSCTLAGPVVQGGLGPLIIAIIFTAFPAIMIFNGPGIVSSANSPLPIAVFAWIFAVLWYVPLTLMMLIAFGIVWTAWGYRKVQYTIKADHNGLALQLRNPNQLMLEKHWPPSALGDVNIRSTSSSRRGQHQTQPLYRLEVTLPDRILGIGSGLGLNQLKEAEAALQRGLDRDPKVEV